MKIVASLIANPKRSLLGLAALCTGLVPIFVDLPPTVDRVLGKVAAVATLAAALVPSASATGKDGAA